MTARYESLSTCMVEHYDTILTPNEDLYLSLDSPATKILTDFRSARPLILEQTTSVDEALLLMKRAHVDVKLVVDREERFLGLVRRETLEGPAILSAAQAYGATRKDLSIAHVMDPRVALRGVTRLQIETSRVGEVLETMRTLGVRCLVVVDGEDNNICGIIMDSTIARLLRVPVDIHSRAKTFAEVVNILHH